MAWLTGWSYRKDISITGQSGAGTDFQVKFNIGDATGGDFHLEGNCTNFPQDIAVTDNDGTTLLDFWIEDITADPLKMWVEVADDLGSNQNIYIYYGKSAETTDSSGVNTFIQYHGETSTSFSMANVKAPPFVIETRTTQTNTTTNDYIGCSNTGWGPTDDAIYNGLQNGYKAATTTKNENVFTQNVISGTYSADAVYKFVASGSDVKFYIDGGLIDTITTNLPNENMGLIYVRGTGTCYYEFIRKYAATEPAFSSAGSEETPVTATTNLLHGKIRIKDSTTTLADGKVQIQDTVTGLVDGKVQIQDTATGLSDGLLIVQDKATGLIDGKVQVQDSTINLVDGKVIISLISAETNQADGKIQIKDVTTSLVDGLIKVKDSVTNLADGKVKISNIGSNLADGLIRIKDTVTNLADGKIIIAEGETSTNLFNGLLRIKDKATGIVDGLLRIIEKPINLADSKVIIADDFNGPFTTTITDSQEYTAVITSTQEYTATITDTQEYTAVIS